MNPLAWLVSSGEEIHSITVHTRDHYCQVVAWEEGILYKTELLRANKYQSSPQPGYLGSPCCSLWEERGHTKKPWVEESMKQTGWEVQDAGGLCWVEDSAWLSQIPWKGANCITWRFLETVISELGIISGHQFQSCMQFSVGKTKNPKVQV